MKFALPTFRLKNMVVLNIILAAVVLELISALQFYHTHQLLADELEKRAESEITMKVIVIKSALSRKRKLSGISARTVRSSP